MSVPRRRLYSDKSGNVAVEFALIGPTLLALLMFIVELGYLLYAQTALDYGVKETARLLQTGQTTATNGTSQASFQATVLCPTLGKFLPCSNITVVLKPVTTFQLATIPPTTPASTATVNPGVSGNLVLLQAFYTPTIPLWPIDVTTLVGTAAYVNE
jgi:Flp pilus assembly protein TadG